MKSPVLFCLLALSAAPSFAQSPASTAPAAAPPPEIAPAHSSAPAGTPVNRPKPVLPVPFRPPAPEPAEPTGVDALSAADVQKAMAALQANYISGLSQDQRDRATLQGLLDRLAPSVSLSGSGEEKESAAPFYREEYQGRLGYLRPGALAGTNLDQTRKALEEWNQKGLGAVVLDLRGTPPGSDFQAAADLAGFFCAKGSGLFKLVRFNGAGAGEDPSPKAFTAASDPLFKGLLVVLVDTDTAGAAETLAAVLRASAKALLVGDPTPGKAFEFNDTPLGHGLGLHVAVARAELPHGAPISGLKPDIDEDPGAADKGEIMNSISAHGVDSVVAEQSRPHLNEAALVAHSDPDIDSLEADQHPKKGPGHPIDRQLQRALDVVTSSSIFQAKSDSGGPGGE